MSNDERERPGESRAPRKLAAVLSADVARYTWLMERDEAGTAARLMDARAVFDEEVGARGGRIVGTSGDGILADFPSVAAALDAAIAIQHEMAERNASSTPERTLAFRMGINLGEVIVEGGDIVGEDVNLAARIEGIADPGTICVSEKVYTEARKQFADRFEDLGTHRVKNVSKPIRVYRLLPGGETAGSRWWIRVAPRAAAVAGLVLALLVAGLVVLEGRKGAGSGPGDSSLPPYGAAVSALPSIAVLPFESQRGEGTPPYLRNGLTQDLISALGRFSGLRVISWDAVFHFGDGPAPIEHVATELGVRYVVRGTVWPRGERIRISLRLTDAQTGALLWAEQYDPEPIEVFAVQDEITQQVVGVLAVQIGAAERERARSKPPDDWDAYDNVLRGREHLGQESRSENWKARERFEAATRISPGFATAWVGLGWTYHHDAAYGWTENPASALEQAFELAQKAIRLDSESSSAHTLLSNVHSHRGRDAPALAEIDRAIELNPGDAEAHAWRGWVLLTIGRLEEAIESSEAAFRFNPNSPPSASGNLGWAYFLESRYAEAIAVLERSLAANPDVLFGQAALAASCAASGRAAEAERAIQDVRRLDPFFDPVSFSELFRRREHQARVVAALGKAGLD